MLLNYRNYILEKMKKISKSNIFNSLENFCFLFCSYKIKHILGKVIRKNRLGSFFNKESLGKNELPNVSKFENGIKMKIKRKDYIKK